MTVALDARPTLVLGGRLRFDEVRQQHQLVIPEGVVTLNESAAEVLALCDGERTAADVIAVLKERYGGADLDADVLELLEGLAAQGVVVL